MQGIADTTAFRGLTHRHVPGIYIVHNKSTDDLDYDLMQISYLHVSLHSVFILLWSDYYTRWCHFDPHKHNPSPSDRVAVTVIQRIYDITALSGLTSSDSCEIHLGHIRVPWWSPYEFDQSDGITPRSFLNTPILRDMYDSVQVVATFQHSHPRGTHPTWFGAFTFGFGRTASYATVRILPIPEGNQQCPKVR